MVPGLAVTVAKYETPNHTDINKLGISPDRVVPLEPIARDKIGTLADLQYQAALQMLKEKTVMAKSVVSSQQSAVSSQTVISNPVASEL